MVAAAFVFSFALGGGGTGEDSFASPPGSDVHVRSRTSVKFTTQTARQAVLQAVTQAEQLLSAPPILVTREERDTSSIDQCSDDQTSRPSFRAPSSDLMGHTVSRPRHTYSIQLRTQAHTAWRPQSGCVWEMPNTIKQETCPCLPAPPSSTCDYEFHVVFRHASVLTLSPLVRCHCRRHNRRRHRRHHHRH